MFTLTELLTLQRKYNNFKHQKETANEQLKSSRVS